MRETDLARSLRSDLLLSSAPPPPPRRQERKRPWHLAICGPLGRRLLLLSFLLRKNKQLSAAVRDTKAVPFCRISCPTRHVATVIPRSFRPDSSKEEANEDEAAAGHIPKSGHDVPLLLLLLYVVVVFLATPHSFLRYSRETTKRRGGGKEKRREDETAAAAAARQRQRLRKGS